MLDLLAALTELRSFTALPGAIRPEMMNPEMMRMVSLAVLRVALLRFGKIFKCYRCCARCKSRCLGCTQAMEQMSRMTPQQVMQAYGDSDDGVLVSVCHHSPAESVMPMQMADMQRQMANLPPGYVQQQMAAMNSMDPALLQQRMRDANLHTPSGQSQTPSGKPSHSPQEVRSSSACLPRMRN